MSQLRFTMIDNVGATSFVAPAHLLKIVAAACCRDPHDVAALVEGIGQFDPGFSATLAAGLRAFDALADRRLQQSGPARTIAIDTEAPFRVIDEATRVVSQQPRQLGLVLINLPARRIVQVQNSYADLRRSDRGRMRRNGRPVPVLFAYELPEAWSIV
ncbi:MAG: hypothetical protein IT337_04890, partial [Thermomicrobiales bacterium]|nr:hypothetical protein [Thermomicrobiales bacterium]